MREHFELRREPLDTRLETPQRILRQQAADETELVAVAVEARVEEFRCDAPDEERVNRAILAPREVSRCEFAQALRLARIRYENGLTSQLELLDAERNLLAAELNRADALRAQRSAVANVVKALGGGWQGLPGTENTAAR